MQCAYFADGAQKKLPENLYFLPFFRKSPHQRIAHVARVYPPFDKVPVGIQPAMQRTRTLIAVIVGEVLAYDAAQLDDVEISVARLQRIESPFDRRQVMHSCVFALREFEFQADACVLPFGQGCAADHRPPPRRR